MRRPSFFLSSTIQDFRDLRSAIKYFLEQQGCGVLASEFNDFPKPLDSHAYEACLRSLHEADYFVLLIGTRVGGWYDPASRISITQQEYREAYKLHRDGKLKLLSFVRADVWRLRTEREALARFLEEVEIDPGAKATIKSYPSASAGDAEFIVSFIDEVSRSKETSAALAGQSPLPTGNWLHVFQTFRDVMDVIQTQAFAGIPIEHVALRRLLLRELLEILRSSLIKYKDHPPLSPSSPVELFHREHKIPADWRDGVPIEVTTKRWDQLSAFGIYLLGMRHDTRILQRALESSAFLSYDLTQSAYREDPVYDALYRLNEEIALLDRANTPEALSVIFEHTPRQRSQGAATISINGWKLLPFLHVLDRWINVIRLSCAVIRYLRGRALSMPPLRPFSPIPEMNIELERERVSLDDVERYLADPK